MEIIAQKFRERIDRVMSYQNDKVIIRYSQLHNLN